MDDQKRLDELRRRVENDPASIAFAAFAEQLSKAGEYEKAVRVCRAGLEHHPTYLSARVTLGRAHLELRQYPEARTELEYVLHAAPDNLLALKFMNALQERIDGLNAAATAAPEAPAVERAPGSRPNLSFATAAAAMPPAAPAPTLEPNPASGPEHPAVGELQRWQSRIEADRAQRPQ